MNLSPRALKGRELARVTDRHLLRLDALLFPAFDIGLGCPPIPNAPPCEMGETVKSGIGFATLAG